MAKASGLRALGVATAGLCAAVAAALLSTAVTATTEYHLIATSTPPTPPASLTPNAQGYVRVTTASSAIGCSVAAALVACQTSSDGWPARSDGTPFHAVSVTAEGEFQFVDADLGALAGKVALSTRTYWAQGWTVAAEDDAISFTNDRSGHGMSVSERKVQPF